MPAILVCVYELSGGTRPICFNWMVISEPGGRLYKVHVNDLLTSDDAH